METISKDETIKTKQDMKETKQIKKWNDGDGTAKGFQNRSMSGQHLQLKTEILECKL